MGIRATLTSKPRSSIFAGVVTLRQNALSNQDRQENVDRGKFDQVRKPQPNRKSSESTYKAKSTHKTIRMYARLGVKT